MKKNILYFLGFVFILFTMINCKKFDEGPRMSLASKKARVANVWKVEYAFDFTDGLNVTSDYSGETWNFDKDGTFTKTSTASVLTGTWQFSNYKEVVSVFFTDYTNNYEIIRLRNKELWIKGLDEEIHLIPNE